MWETGKLQAYPRTSAKRNDGALNTYLCCQQPHFDSARKFIDKPRRRSEAISSRDARDCLKIRMKANRIDLPSQGRDKGFQCICIRFKNLGVNQRRGGHGSGSIIENETQSYINYEAL